MHFHKLVFNHSGSANCLQRVNRKAASMIGLRHIPRLNQKLDETEDTWFAMDAGKKSLQEWLCSVKTHQWRGEQIYSIKHGGFYRIHQENNGILPQLIKSVCEFLQVMVQFRHVHGDLRPENILIEFNEYRTFIADTKVVDYGNTCCFDDMSKIGASSVEYLPPEVLEFIKNRTQYPFTASAASVTEKSFAWSVDIWSLGVILMEIATGYPVWMGLKVKQLNLNGKSYVGKGLFGVKDRQLEALIAQQKKIVSNIPATLKKFESYGLAQDEDFLDLLGKMLQVDPKKRISPHGILKHKYLNKE